MKNYYRVMLGEGSAHAAECFAEGFVGADFGIDQDLSNELPEEWRLFNKKFVPVFLAKYPAKNKIGAGLACGMLWTVSKGIKRGDTVLCPDGQGVYRLGEVTGDYYYASGQFLPHRRRVQWLPTQIARSAMSEALRRSTGSIGTVSMVTSHQQEIEKFLAEGQASSTIVATDQTIEDPVAFAMERHLEDFLVRNWKQTELSRDYAIFEEDGQLVGQQYSTDAGPIDILALSKDKKRILVIELKRGRATDVVVGQTLRYMGYVMDQIAEPGQTVEGIIIALEDDSKLRWALMAVPSIRFYRYQIDFKLQKA